MSSVQSSVQVRVQFLDYLFDEQEGFLCIATASPTAMQTSFTHEYFEWPIARAEVAKYIQIQSKSHHVWFCVSLLKNNAMGPVKVNCLPGSFVWSDLDRVGDGDLRKKSIPASSIIETSPGRYQAFWRLQDGLVPPDVREDLSKKITYYVEADKGGWACNKLMRVPHTKNFKYEDKPEVKILFSYETLVPMSVIEGLPEPTAHPSEVPTPDMPDITMLPEATNVVYKYSYSLHNTAFRKLYVDEPAAEDDWSSRMWRLINILYEAGLSKDEILSLTINAACNKYKRDNRPLRYLWLEIIKAEALQTHSLTITGEYKPLTMPELVDPDLQFDNFVSQYKDWASIVTDAVPEYHDLCAFILLSAVLSSNVKLKASFGELIPNIWGLILGDSTLTRKTTAMELAMSFLREVDKDAVVATDGSPEGLVTVLGQRPEQVSLYFKDEVSGLFSAMNNKSYLADMPELLTKMYDVPKHYSRTLRKETITITSPFFIFFGGGIKDKVYSLINDQYVLSGFLPRFLVVTGYADLTRIRETGPPNDFSEKGRNKILNKIEELHNSFGTLIPMKVGSQLVHIPQTVEATMTPEAWQMFAEVETKLITAAYDSPNSMMALPTFTRLAFSGLKMAILLAASRGPDSAKRVIVTKSDLEQACWYIQSWGRHSIDLINNAGVTEVERLIDRLVSSVIKNPGCTKTFLMRNHKLSSKEMGDVMTTIVDRGLITVTRSGRGMVFHAVGV